MRRSVDPPDPRLGAIMLDANVLQGGGAQAQAAERLLDLNREGLLDCRLSASVYAELMNPATPPEVRLRAQGLVSLPHVPLSQEEVFLRRRAVESLQGDAKPGRHAADALHLVEAYRTGVYFVTNDRRVLSRREALCGVMPRLHMVTPTQLLEAFDAWEAMDDSW